jgi:hypothetical protein
MPATAAPVATQVTPAIRTPAQALGMPAQVVRVAPAERAAGPPGATQVTAPEAIRAATPAEAAVEAAAEVEAAVAETATAAEE